MFTLDSLAASVLSELVASFIEQAGTKLLRQPRSDDASALQQAFQAGIDKGFQTIADPATRATRQVVDGFEQLIKSFFRGRTVKENLSLLIFPQELQLNQATSLIETLRAEFHKSRIGTPAAEHIPIDFDKFIAAFLQGYYEEAKRQPALQTLIEIERLDLMVQQLVLLVPLMRRTTLATEITADNTTLIARQLEALTRLLQEMLEQRPLQPNAATDPTPVAIDPTDLREVIGALLGNKTDQTVSSRARGRTRRKRQPIDPPYKGLLPYNEKDTKLFFGRSGLSAELTERVLTWDTPGSMMRCLCIVGASGSGKSSLLQAGLLPAWRERTNWRIVFLTPRAHPVKTLAVCLTAGSESVSAALTLQDDIMADVRSLDVHIQRLVGAGERLLLVIDQFEELFTLCRDEAERRAFINNLMYAVSPVTGGTTMLVMSLRADHYGRCGQYASLREALQTNQVYIGPMNYTELHEVVVQPADEYGCVFEPGLVGLILRDCGVTPDEEMSGSSTLPLLSHALLMLWNEREGERLTLAAYQKVGGVRGAIARTADRLLKRFDVQEYNIARHIFLQLIEVDEQTVDTRRRVSWPDLIPASLRSPLLEQAQFGILATVIPHSTKSVTLEQFEDVLNQLIGARLITAEQEAFTIAHEALIREWDTLRDWVHDGHEVLHAHSKLQRATLEWFRNQQDPSFLYRGKQLEWALQLFGGKFQGESISLRDRLAAVNRRLRRQSGPSSHTALYEEALVDALRVSLNESESQFIAASIAARRTEQKAARLRLARVAAIVTFLVAFIAVVTQVEWFGGSWNAVDGIFGGSVIDITIDPVEHDTWTIAIDAIRSSYLLQSHDSGASWTALASPLTTVRVNTILASSSRPGELFAGANGAGVFKSTDGGLTWQTANEGLPNFNVIDLVESPDQGGTLYLLAYGRDGGVFRSANGGRSWQAASTGLSSRVVTELAVDPEQPSTLYVGTENQGLFKSVDRGDHWQATGLDSGNAQQIALDPSDSRRIYVGVYRVGVLRSEDSGDTWIRLYEGLPDYVVGIGDIQVSRESFGSVVTAIETRGGTQALLSQDRGLTWTPLDADISGADVYSIVEDPLQSGAFWVGSRSGLHFVGPKPDQNKWVEIGVNARYLNGVEFSHDGSVVYLSSYGGIFRSTDGAQTWRFANQGLTHPTIRVLRADPVDASRVYAGTFSDGAPDVIFVSNDAGQSWEPFGSLDGGLLDDDVRDIAVSFDNNQIVYAATYGSGVFATEDGGLTWQPANAGIIRKEIVRLVVNPIQPEQIFAVASGGPIYRSGDAGNTWEAVPETVGREVIDMDIAADGTWLCFAIFNTSDENVWCSQDAGNSWAPTGEAVHSRFLRHVNIGPSAAAIYTATDDQGIFLSRDHGRTWTALDRGLGSGAITRLEINRANANQVYAVVEKDGAYALELGYRWEEWLKWLSSQ